MTNGLDPLQAFDKRVLKHFTEGEFRGTRAALVKGLDLYIGIAQCVSFDQFNRRKGRQIAKGRALQAWKEDVGVAPKALRKHSGSFYFKTSVNTPEEIDAALIKYIFLDTPKPATK
jgi:hypothetical protein